MKDKEYLDENHNYWEQGYVADNVESFVFRPFGRIISKEFGLTGKNGEKVLDFGCGRGAALNFYRSKGFDIYGVDISDVDIQYLKKALPSYENNFKVISPTPSKDDVFFDTKFDLVTGIQSLYYYDDDDLQKRLQSLYNCMKPNAIIYVTMIGNKHYMYNHSAPYKNGLRHVKIDGRIKMENYINFTNTELELLEKFSMFEKIHTGFYDAQYDETEGGSFHFTFIGKKVD